MAEQWMYVGGTSCWLYISSFSDKVSSIFKSVFYS